MTEIKSGVSCSTGEGDALVRQAYRCGPGTEVYAMRESHRGGAGASVYREVSDATGAPYRDIASSFPTAPLRPAIYDTAREGYTDAEGNKHVVYHDVHSSYPAAMMDAAPKRGSRRCRRG